MMGYKTAQRLRNMLIGAKSRPFFRDIQWLLTNSLVSRAISLPLSIYVAWVLGPQGLGTLRAVDFIPSLAKTGSLGFGSVAVRDIRHHGDNLSETARDEILYSSYKGELIWSVFLAAAGIASIQVYREQNLLTGSLIACVIFLSNVFYRCHYFTSQSRSDFVLISRAGIATVVANAIMVLILTRFLSWYGVLLGSLAGSFAGILLYRTRIRISLQEVFRKGTLKEIRRQAPIGISLAWGTFAYGSFALVDRFFVGAYGGLEKLGIYMLGITIYESMLLISNNIGQALSTRIYDALRKDTGSAHCVNLMVQPCFLVGWMYVILGGLGYFMLPCIINLVLPKFSRVIPLLPFIFVSLVAKSLGITSGLALNSTAMNKQILHSSLWTVAVGLYFAVAISLVHFGFEVMLSGMTARMISLFLVSSFISFFGMAPIMGVKRSIVFALRYCALITLGCLTAFLLAHFLPGTTTSASLIKSFAFCAVILPLPFVFARSVKAWLLYRDHPLERI